MHWLVSHKEGLRIYKEVRKDRNKEIVRQGRIGVMGVDEINEKVYIQRVQVYTLGELIVRR